VSQAELERHDGIPVVRPSGDIDAANAAALREQLADSMDHGADRLILDLSGVRYLDSAGIDMLFRLGELLRQRRATLLLVIAPDSNLARLADIVGLSRALTVHPSVDEALGAAPPRAVGP
jgi:anti-sigma B factor antagonist